MTEASETDRQALLSVRCQRGEREAWAELVSGWERPLFYYLRRMSPTDEEALSLLQDVWVRVFSNLGSLSQPERLAPWLYVIARRTWARRFAVSAREAVSMEDEGELEQHEPVEEHGDAEAMHQALGLIALRDREVLTLFYLDDLSLAEVAEVLEIPAGTVKSRLSHARARLRAQLQRMKVKDD